MNDMLDIFSLMNGEEPEADTSDAEKELQVERELEELKTELMEIDDEEPSTDSESVDSEPISEMGDEVPVTEIESLTENSGTDAPVVEAIPESTEPSAEKSEEKKRDPLDPEEFSKATEGMSSLEKAEYKLDLFLAGLGKESGAIAIGNWQGLVDYLKMRCRESESLQTDILAEHKTISRMNSYIFQEAKKLVEEVKRGKATPMLSDTVVFEWAEDYFRADDLQKILDEEKRAEELKEKTAKAKNSAPKDKKKPAPKPKSKAKPKQEDNQLDLFALMSQE